MKTKTIQFYADPGHGWGRVRLKLLEDLGIADQISGCSYLRGQWAYLEEDCDLSLLEQKLKENNIPFKYQEFHTNKQSKIRGYAHYKHAKVGDLVVIHPKYYPRYRETWVVGTLVEPHYARDLYPGISLGYRNLWYLYGKDFHRWEIAKEESWICTDPEKAFSFLAEDIERINTSIAVTVNHITELKNQGYKVYTYGTQDPKWSWLCIIAIPSLTGVPKTHYLVDMRSEDFLQCFTKESVCKKSA